jgi:hypothetical protein
VKKAFIYILIISQLIFAGNFWVVYAAIGDIGHWRDSAWGQIPSTTFSGFNFDSEIRNDGIYTKPNNSTVEVTEAGDYLIIATTHDEDTSNGRYNSQLRVLQTLGSGEIFSSHYTGYSRDNSENESWSRAVWIVIGASANSRFQVQKRRDTDAPTGGSVVNSSDLQVIRLSQTNYWIYNIWGTGNSYGGISPNTVDITNIVSESSTTSIEWNTGTDTITLKGDNKKYLTAWSVSFYNPGNRTQRIWHLEYDGVDDLSTRSYCYIRNSANQYCGVGSMHIIETGTTDASLQTEVFMWEWIWVDQWGANYDGGAYTDGTGQMIVLEMPDYLEYMSSQDSVWLQDISASQTLNFSRDVIATDSLSFTKASDSRISITHPADIFSWANIWTARSNVWSTRRLTSYSSFVLDGIDQTTWRHGNYSRWNQGSTDTFAMSLHPAGIYTSSFPWSTLELHSDPLAGTEGGGWDRTQPGTLWFFALNLDTFIAPSIDQSSYRIFNNTDSTDVGTPLASENTSATLLNDGDAFRLRMLLDITNNKLRKNEWIYKLQYAEKVGSCDTSFSGEVYNDVTVSSEIAFFDNPTPADNSLLTSNGNDPVSVFPTTVSQSYSESNNFTVSHGHIWKDESGKWDFSLIENTPSATSYCLRIVKDDNSLLDSYSFIPEIETTLAVDPILSVTFTDDDTDNTVQTSQIVRFDIEIQNAGVDATGVSAVAPIDSVFGSPYGFTYTNCWSPSETFTAPDLTFSNISVLSGNTCSISYYAQVDNLAPNGASISTSIDVSAATEWGNDSANITWDIFSVLACGINDVSIVFETDSYGEDTFWSLVPSWNSCWVGEIANGWNPNLSCSDAGSPATAWVNDPYADSSIITEGSYSLSVWDSYDLHVIDDYGDGITLGANATDPDVRIQQNGWDTDTFSVTGDGGVFSFTVQQPVACIDAINPEITVNQSPSQVDPTSTDSATFKVIFNETINAGTFTSSDISLSGTSGNITVGPIEVSPFNGTSFEFTVTGMTDGDIVTASIPAGWIEDTSGNTNNASSSSDNEITYSAGETIPPTISSTNFSNDSLLPWTIQDIIIHYSDADSGIDTSSAAIDLYKWDGSIWGSDISSTGLTLNSIWINQAHFSTNNLSYWKYRYDFSISDNEGNVNNTTSIVFYLDEPEFIIWSPEINIGNITAWQESYSTGVTLTVKTIGAPFDIILNRSGNFDEGTDTIQDYDGIHGFWYDVTPLSGNITPIATDEIIVTQVENINIDGEKNTYIYNIQIWALISEEQTAGDYLWNLDFRIELDY